jgi:nucleolar protein 56
MARAQVQEAYTGKGASLIQAVRAIDDLDFTRSLLFSRLDEWWKINFPEFRMENEESYAKIVATFGSREDFEYAALAQIVGDESATRLLDLAQRSFGVKFTAEEKKGISELAQGVLSLIVSRKQLEDFVNKQSSVVLKNVSYLVEGVVAARLLAVAGGLEKLAEMPSSTIQVIGAEKALFKHLRTGTAPPKHGIIFQASIVRGAPLSQRGRIARSLAAKLAIAAKADAFTGNFIAGKLKESLDARLAQIRKKG